MKLVKDNCGNVVCGHYKDSIGAIVVKSYDTYDPVLNRLINDVEIMKKQLNIILEKLNGKHSI